MLKNSLVREGLTARAMCASVLPALWARLPTVFPAHTFTCDGFAWVLRLFRARGMIPLQDLMNHVGVGALHHEVGSVRTHVPWCQGAWCHGNSVISCQGCNDNEKGGGEGRGVGRSGGVEKSGEDAAESIGVSRVGREERWHRGGKDGEGGGDRQGKERGRNTEGMDLVGFQGKAAAPIAAGTELVHSYDGTTPLANLQLFVTFDFTLPPGANGRNNVAHLVDFMHLNLDELRELLRVGVGVIEKEQVANGGRIDESSHTSGSDSAATPLVDIGPYVGALKSMAISTAEHPALNRALLLVRNTSRLRDLVPDPVQIVLEVMCDSTDPQGTMERARGRGWTPAVSFVSDSTNSETKTRTRENPTKSSAALAAVAMAATKAAQKRRRVLSCMTRVLSGWIDVTMRDIGNWRKRKKDPAVGMAYASVEDATAARREASVRQMAEESIELFAAGQEVLLSCVQAGRQLRVPTPSETQHNSAAIDLWPGWEKANPTTTPPPCSWHETDICGSALCPIVLKVRLVAAAGLNRTLEMSFRDRGGGVLSAGNTEDSRSGVSLPYRRWLNSTAAGSLEACVALVDFFRGGPPVLDHEVCRTIICDESEQAASADYKTTVSIVVNSRITADSNTELIVAYVRDRGPAASCRASSPVALKLNAAGGHATSSPWHSWRMPAAVAVAADAASGHQVEATVASSRHHNPSMSATIPSFEQRPDLTVLAIASYCHDASISILRGGQLVEVLELERLYNRRYFDCTETYLHRGEEDFDFTAALGRCWNRAFHEICKTAGIYAFDVGVITTERGTGWFANGSGWPVERWVFAGHHAAHASTSFFSSPFSTALVVSIDLGGKAVDASGSLILDHPNTVLHIGTRGGATAPWTSHAADESDVGLPGEAALTLVTASITDQAIYQRCACLISEIGPHFRDVDQCMKGDMSSLPGKLMGYSALGKPQEEWVNTVEDILWGKELVDRAYSNHAGVISSLQQSMKRIWIADEQEQRLTVERDLAASCQAAMERLVLRIVREGLRKYPWVEGIVLGGGLALNVLANELVRRRVAGGRGVYVSPAPGDHGNSVGAGWLVMPPPFVPPTSMDNSGLERAPRAVLYDGPRNSMVAGAGAPLSLAYAGPPLFDLADVPALANTRGAVYLGNGTATGIAQVAALLASGAIVGIARGRSEFGPRALGHRSLVAVPSKVSAKDRMNRIKHREWWRPVAPVMTEHAATQLFDLGVGDPSSSRSVSSPYMSFAGKLKNDVAAKLPAMHHFDGTVRAQTVKPEDDPWLFALLEAVGRLTGYEVLINTSFNTRGRPILNRASEALELLDAMPDLDAVVLGNWLFEKTNGKRS